MEGGGNDQELVCRTLQFEHKLFYFDMKRNPRGPYLKISEKTSATRSTIIVPIEGFIWFIRIFTYYIDTPDQDILGKELKIESKLFFFEVGENKRGRYLKVAEASVSRNRSTIIVPAGSSGVEGWVAFRNTLQEVYEEASRFLALPDQLDTEPEHLPGLSDDVGAGFISGHNTESSSGPELTVDQLIELPPQDEIGGLETPNCIKVDQKRFYFDLGSNNRGHFLRIAEVAGNDRSLIILPLSGLKQFHEMVGHFVEIAKDRFADGMSGPNAHTIESAKR